MRFNIASIIVIGFAATGFATAEDLDTRSACGPYLGTCPGVS